jgi:hypothetical protein
MRGHFALTMLISVVMVGTLSANAGPPQVPKGRKVIEPAVRFEGIDKHPDYIFHLQYGAAYFGARTVELKDAHPVKVTFQGSGFLSRGDRYPAVSYMALLAMQRNDFDRRKKDDPSLKWLNAETKGILEAKLTPPETTAPVTVKDIPVTTYRVTLKDGKLTAEKVEEKKNAAIEPAGGMPPWMFGIISSLSMVWLGIWFARRGGPSSAQAATPVPDTATDR